MLPKIWTVTAKLLVIVAVLLLVTESTDADLIDRETVPNNSITATTLDFSTRDTANNTQKTVFFNVQGMVKGGFQVNSVRIKNDGELPVNFTITTQQTGGDTSVCNSLQLKLLKNWQVVENKSLPTFKYDSSIETNELQDLVFSLDLPYHSPSPSFSNCLFTITIKTDQSNQSSTRHFFDEEVLDNQVSTGG